MYNLAPSLEKKFRKLQKRYFLGSSDEVQRLTGGIEAELFCLLDSNNATLAALDEKISRLEIENRRSTAPKVVDKVVAATQIDKQDLLNVKLKLLNLHGEKKLPPFETKRGRGATDSDVWIKNTLAHFNFTEAEINIALAYPAVWYKVDKILYQSRSMRNIRANKGAA